MSRHRNPPVAQQLLRAATQRALAAELTSRELRVFVALLSEIALFDRVEDRIANRRLVELTGLDARHVRRALKRLHELGVIVREPGSSRKDEHRVASLISLATGGQISPPNRGPDWPSVPGADSDHDRGPVPARIRCFLR